MIVTSHHFATATHLLYIGATKQSQKTRYYASQLFNISSKATYWPDIVTPVHHVYNTYTH